MCIFHSMKQELIPKSSLFGLGPWNLTLLLISAKLFIEIKEGFSGLIPKLILDKRNTPQKSRPSDDINSFGIVVSEPLSEQIPFKDIDKENLLKLIVGNNYQPSLENIPQLPQKSFTNAGIQTPYNVQH